MYDILDNVNGILKINVKFAHIMNQYHLFFELGIIGGSRIDQDDLVQRLRRLGSAGRRQNRLEQGSLTTAGAATEIKKRKRVNFLFLV